MDGRTYTHDFGSRVRAAREAAGLSQREVAARLGITERTLRAIETGDSDPQLSVAIRLGEILGMRVIP